MTGSASVPPLSHLLAETLQGETTITVGEIADRVAERGFGLLMVVLALPTLIPVLPPGTAATIGLLYILLSLQMVWGLDRPWLPQRVRRYRLGPSAVRSLRTRGVPMLQRLERFSRPRLIFPDERVTTRLIAVAVFLLGIVLFSPLPFLNTLPAFTVFLLGIGLLNRDGIFIAVGLLLTVGVILVIAFAAGTLYALLDWLRTR